MFWPIVLPFQITVVLVILLVGTLTVVAPRLKWNRVKTFSIASASAFFLFVPACIGIHYIADVFRFGEFHYTSYADVNDFRVERTLPPGARNITLVKYASGFEAKYSISESDLKSFLDLLWEQFGEHSAVERENPDWKVRRYDPMELVYLSNRWALPLAMIPLSTPRAANGAGATIYYDPVNQIAYHRAGYW